MDFRARRRTLTRGKATYESSHAKVVPTIEICPATYSEQVTITKSLVLTRATVAQPWRPSRSSRFRRRAGGANAGGASVALTHSIVQKIGGDATTDGCQGGVDVEAGDSVTDQVGHLYLSGDTIESYAAGRYRLGHRR